MRWRHGRAQVELEGGDDRWGPPISPARRGAKAVRGEAFPREGGGNRAGRHRCVAGWVGREAEAQWGEGEWPVGEGKRKWAAAGPKAGVGPNSSNKTFLNFYLNSKFWQLWKFVQGDLEGILTWEFLLNSSKLLKDFRKI
jgi:hypothetical protein